MEDVLSLYNACSLCPHECKVDRRRSTGFCKEISHPHIAWTGLHKGEEPPISGDNGSGMLFFTGCTLGCPTCQNIQISSKDRDKTIGRYYSEEEMADVMLTLQNNGAATISFVTAEHFAPSVIKSIIIAREKGLKLKTVFNTSGYMKRDTIKLLNPYIDIWLWDMKTLSPLIAEKYFGFKNYPEIEEDGIKCLQALKADAIVRHLVIPAFIDESIDVINHFNAHYKDSFAFSLMYQFLPPKDTRDEALLKPLTNDDLERIKDALYSTDIENGFEQDPDPNEEQWRPNFKNINPFPESFARAISMNTNLNSDKITDVINHEPK